MLKIKDSAVLKPERLKNTKLYQNEEGYYAKQDKSTYHIKSYDIDPLLKKLKGDKLQKFLDIGYISLHQMDNEDFVLKAHVRGLGGGPILAGIFYWGTKAICYGTALAAGSAAVTTVVVASGGSVAPVMVGAALVKAAGAGSTIGMAAVSAGITTSGGTAIATTLTAGTLTSAGSIPAAIALVESAASAAGTIGMLIPWL